MKRLLVIVLAAILLVGCGNEENDGPLVGGSEQDGASEKKEVIRETINEREHDILLIDNDDLKITLLESEHIRFTDYEDKDAIILKLSVENKQNRTFRVLFDKISIDGRSERFDIGWTESEIKPNETVMSDLSFTVDILNENKLLEFEEHLSGRITYSDYDGNREQITFSEYINE